MPKRQVFYSFHFDNDVFRVSSSIAKCNTWESRKVHAILSGYVEKISAFIPNRT